MMSMMMKKRKKREREKKTKNAHSLLLFPIYFRYKFGETKQKNHDA